MNTEDRIVLANPLEKFHCMWLAQVKFKDLTSRLMSVPCAINWENFDTPGFDSVTQNSAACACFNKKVVGALLAR